MTAAHDMRRRSDNRNFEITGIKKAKKDGEETSTI
jgi:hypothetical protein